MLDRTPSPTRSPCHLSVISGGDITNPKVRDSPRTRQTVPDLQDTRVTLPRLSLTTCPSLHLQPRHNPVSPQPPPPRSPICCRRIGNDLAEDSPPSFQLKRTCKTHGPIYNLLCHPSTTPTIALAHVQPLPPHTAAVQRVRTHWT